MAQLFGRDIKTIGKHINNALKEETELSTVAKFATVQTEGTRDVTRMVEHYNLDMIISVGYRVKSKQGIAFRRWASSVLKDYMLKGYAINEKRLESLNKTIEIKSKMLASALELEGEDVYKVVIEYTKTLDLLDDYDHQSLNRPEGNDTLYRLNYEECRKLIDSMKFNSDVFGVEKEKGKLNGIWKQFIRMSLVRKYIQALKRRLPIFSISLSRTTLLRMAARELVLQYSLSF